MTDLGITEAKHRHQGIVTTNQLDIAINIDLAPADRPMVSREYHQCLAHGIAQVALLAIVED